MKFLRCSLVISFIISYNSLFCQSDTTFWFAAPEVSFNNPFNSNLDRPIELHITAGNSASIVTVSMPANPSFIPIIQSLAANTTATIDLTTWINQIETKPANQVLNSGILIKSNSKITAYYEVSSAGCNFCNPEFFTLKGNNAEGTNFFIPSQNFLDNNPNYTPVPKSSFDIVATENNTTVSITPSKDIVGHTAGNLFTVVLNKGQTYSATAVSGLAANHLGGSVVSSDKKIAITVKDDLLAAAGGCADLGGDQTVPVTLLGVKYIAIRGYLNPPYDKLFVTAVSNNTQIKVDGIVVTTINAGATFTVNMTNPVSYIETSLPAYVLQLSGFGCEIGIAVLPPIECTGSATLNATRSAADGLFLNILVPAGGQNSFRYNGLTGIINAADFAVVPATGGQWYYTSKNISTAITASGSPFSISNSVSRFQLGVIHGDPGWGCRFGYFSDYNTFKANISSNGPRFCSADTLRLHADSIANTIIQWTGPNGFNSTAANPKLFVNNAVNSGYYKVVINDPTCGVVTDSILVTVDITSVVTNANATICTGGSVQLNTTGAATYSWSPATGLSNPNIANPIATPAITTQYIVTGTKPSGCVGKDTVVITVAPTGCSGIGNVINDYTPVLAFDKCKNILTVDDAANYNTGDTVLLIQMKGADIDSTNTAAFGTIINYNNAGNYEFNLIKSKTGNNIELLNAVTRNYDLPHGKVQLIRVPYYQDANITSTLTCQPWNGSTGGILVLNVRDSVTLNADIDVSGKGFRGGAGFNNGLVSTSNCFQNEYFYPIGSAFSGNKGESITSVSNNITGGKGALASGGGAGLDHNGGGGGGGNGGAGGFGGYQLLECGNSPFDNRGIGGKSLNYTNAANKIFMGGGGGSGHANNPGTVPAGGNGGGIIIINVPKIKNNNVYKITTNGNDANSCTPNPPGTTCHDGMGGGGAGGTVLLNTNQVVTSTIIEEKGGKGANMTGAIIGGTIGPGGGGAGGVLWVNTTALPATVSSVNTGGIRGVIVANGNAWGTTNGLAGINVFSLQIPIDIIPFKPNIDSVRFNLSNTSCTQFSFSGLAYINSSAITSWQWYFGDGGTANTQSTSHTYSTSGIFTVKLVVTDGTGCKDSVSRQVTATIPNFDFSYQQDVCNPWSVQFFGAGNPLINPYWEFGDAGTVTGNNSPTHVYASYGNYTVRYTVNNAGCNDTITKTINLNLTQADIVITPDTTICFGATKLLRAQPSANFCWSPTTYLNNPVLNNPTTSTPGNITYYYTAEILGTNLIINGDFSAGNTGFTTAYNYAANNTTEGQYFFGSNSVAWNGGTAPCVDHTTGNGNMMMVNGAPVPNTVVWKQTVNVTPNTNYNFACWAQSIYFANPAQLQFSINNILIGNIFSPGGTTCNWQRFFSNWNSGNNTSAVISIVNLNTLVGGNDFALDDISFATTSIKRDSVKITVDTPVVAAIGAATICSGTSTQLNASGAATYSWTPATGLSNANIANPVATPAVNTIYTVTGTTVNGCTAQNTATITVLPKPVITKIPDTSICNSTSIQLFASGGTSYVWTPAATLNNPNIANPIATPTATATKYYVTVINGNVNLCSSRDSVIVTIKPAPVFSVSPSKSTCQGTAVQLTASGGDTYLWSPTALVTNPAIRNPFTNTASSALYSVTITKSVCNISTTLSTFVTVNPLPVVNAISSNDINCSLGFANLQASGASQYIWTPATGLNNAIIANPVATPVITTQYIVKGVNDFGCTGADTLTVMVTTTGNSGYFMPNSFTPNGDSKNDCFGIKLWGIVQELEFLIYNRYGEKVFYTTDPNKCWDGRYKSEKPEPGNYVYYIQAKTACGNVERKGNVVLIR